MTKYALLIAPACVLLASCGNIADSEEMMTAFADSCKQGVMDQGIPEALADKTCEGSAGKVKEQELGPMDMLDEDKMMAIGEECAAEIIAGMDADAG